MNKPEHGWCTSCTVTRVLDGDTIEVIVTKKMRVRLLDCWAPETHGEEKSAGIKSKRHLERIALGHTGTLFVPVEDDGGLKDILTMERFLGYVWIDGDDVDLSTRQVEAGFAKPNKLPHNGLDINVGRR